jgi:hypothetical protein
VVSGTLEWRDRLRNAVEIIVTKTKNCEHYSVIG